MLFSLETIDFDLCSLVSKTFNMCLKGQNSSESFHSKKKNSKKKLYNFVRFLDMSHCQT